MKASDLFVRCLENEGITHIFGVPGEENADFMMSLQGSSIEFVITRHEQGAAFMAEVHGRLTGNPAGCLGTLGPGAANLITGVADGNMDRAPMLVLTGQGSTDRLHKESHQIMDVVAMYRPVTKWAYQITNAEILPEAVRKAVRLARAEKPGAVLLELPEDVASREVDGQPMPVRRFRRPTPDADVVAAAAEQIAAARRPVVLAGNGAVRKRASAELRRFAELTGIGVVSTFMGKGAVDLEDPACLFTVGLQARDQVSTLLEAADLVVCVGYDLVEYHPELWNESASRGAEGKTLVHVDFTPAEIDEFYNPEVELVGDIALALDALNRALEPRAPFRFDLARQRETRATMLAEFREHTDDDTEGSIRPQKALWDLRQELGPDDLLLSGVGAHKMWVGRMWNCHEPNTCIIPNGFCSMGLPLPGVVAAKIARPDAKVVGLVGDGDFLMNVQEMETARRLGSDVTVLVWEDKAYGLIEWKQDTHFGKHVDLSFTNPDWLKLADAFGWHGQFVANSRDLRPALRRALDHRGPSLVVMPVDYRENALLTERLGNIVCPI